MGQALHLACLVVILISSALCESIDDYCDSEVTKTIEETCVVTASNIELANVLQEYSENRKTLDEFKRFYADYCIRITNYTNCVEETVIPILSDQCLNSKELESVQVNIKYSKIFSQFYCENDSKRQMDAIEDDGVGCLFSDAYIKCLSNKIHDHKYYNHEANCELIVGTISCEHILDRCANQYVKNYRSELFRILRDEFNCV